jgi:hypothetical protein
MAAVRCQPGRRARKYQRIAGRLASVRDRNRAVLLIGGCSSYGRSLEPQQRREIPIPTGRSDHHPRFTAARNWTPPSNHACIRPSISTAAGRINDQRCVTVARTMRARVGGVLGQGPRVFFSRQRRSGLLAEWMFGTTLLIAGDGKHVSTDRDIQSSAASPSMRGRPWKNHQKSLADTSLRG